MSLADEHVEDDAVEDHPDQAHDGLQGPEVGELVPGPDDHIRGGVAIFVVVVVVIVIVVVVGGGGGAVGGGDGEVKEQQAQYGQGATPPHVHCHQTTVLSQCYVTQEQMEQKICK